MENFNETIELQEMRSQLALLNKKLENEHILNENLLRNTMRDKISGLRKERWIITALTIAMIPSLYDMYAFYNMSLLFVSVTFLLFIVCLVFTWMQWRQLDENDFMTGNLCDSVMKITKMHRQNYRWNFYGIPVFILWLIWNYYELFNSGVDMILIKLCTVGGIIGGIIGGVCSIIYYLKTQNTLKDMIRQIEDFNKE